MRKLEKAKSIMIVLLSVMAAGCSNINSEQQENHGIAIEQQTERENQGKIFDESSNTYSFYNKEKCETEVSPLSTFKIVSALAGLENNVLVNETSTMGYSGVIYSIDAWNANLTLKEAFEISCVWYFRQVVA